MHGVGKIILRQPGNGHLIMNLRQARKGLGRPFQSQHSFVRLILGEMQPRLQEQGFQVCGLPQQQ
ncbi:MAG: hypothetical protein BWX84_02404 [Verrucomicrobia bacterium ADurb.Bin118]|nr:MAG: hypothetical protein BWX84_02404 [Verrucomicrobia bacterium ADurb.Bin118]